MDGARPAELTSRFVDASWRREWLDDSEVSIRLGDPGSYGTSLFFHDEAKFDAFLRANPGVGVVLGRDDVVMRQRFRLAPRRWVKRKLHHPTGRTEWSQYFQVSPKWSDYPLTTLRLFLRTFGRTPPEGLGGLLAVPLADPRTIWGLALKYPEPASDRSPRPVLSFTVPPDGLGRAVGSLTEGGMVDEGAAEACLEAVAPLVSRRHVYLTVDTDLRQGPCVIDVQWVPRRLLPVQDGRVAAEALFRYAKCRVEPGAASAAWTGYFPFDHLSATAQPAGHTASRDGSTARHLRRDNRTVVGPANA